MGIFTDKRHLATCALWWHLCDKVKPDWWDSVSFLAFSDDALEIGHRKLALRFFLSRLRTFLTLLGFFLLNLWRDCELKLFLLPQRQITLAFDTLNCKSAPLIKFHFEFWIFFSNHQFQIDQVWYCDKLGERPQRHWEQTLTFLYPVPPTWEQVVNSSKCSTVPGLY